MQRSLEQRMAIKFSVKLEKSAAETIPMLKKAFGVDCLSTGKFSGGTRHSQNVGKMSTTRTALDGHQPPLPTTMNEEGVCEAQPKLLTDDQKARRASEG
ncbi:hypothetical protein NQ318_015027 [Aromia moschata]|uniref:Uncharacterized protein n=1 Tax=Aromia moschata TaxID=1265417 RepID=A0AAV8YZD7_9CUCU|nr:hypothetical protein NQ318_015027 [Aromia moschata]